MFATLEGTVDQARERRREARRRELRSLCAQEARIKQRVRQIVREAEDEGDWRAAGCSSSAQWLAQVSSSDHRSAERITRTSSALRSLPALDHALSTGALSLDQVAAAAEYATPGTDAELARVAVGKAPSAIALAARTLVPPAVEDDQELYQRRALNMTWTRGRRELCFSGRCRSNRAPPSSRPSGTSPRPNAPPTSRPAPSSTGSSPPRTPLSPSPATARAQTVA